MSFLARLAADIAVQLGQPITSFCDLHTAEADGGPILTDRGEAVSVVRVLGVRRALREGSRGAPLDGDVVFHADAMREELTGALERPGHAMQWWFASDPSLAGPAVERANAEARAVAWRIGLALEPVFAERGRRWPALMRWEACCLALWTRRGAFTREEGRAEARRRREAEAAGMTTAADAQNPFLSTGVLLGKHAAFVRRTLGALHAQGIGYEEITPREMAAAARESVLPETVGAGWRARLLGDPAAAPREGGHGAAGDAAVLPPPLRDQMLAAAADTEEAALSAVRIGAHLWASLDMALGPENTRPFAELVRLMADTGIPWRASFLMEGGGEFFFRLKEAAASVLGFGQNKKIWRGVEANKKLKEANADVTVRLRVSFATWAPADRTEELRLRRAALEHRVQAWGNMQVAAIAGDPLAGVMSSALAAAPASTAVPHQAPLFDALKMAPWARPGSPWSTGPILFRAPDGRMWPMDPAGSGRQRVLNLFSGPSRHGKSVLANTYLLGLCLSSAAQGAGGAFRLPLVGKIDIGRSAEGLVLLLREALPEDRRHEALYVGLQFIPNHAANVLDTQVGCREPLELERAFQENFLSLATTALGMAPFEGMGQLLTLVLREAYRMFGTEGPNRRPKPYAPGRDARVDAALKRNRIALRADAWWWDAVDALCDAGDRLHAEMAQRYAVPTLEDLVTASRSPQVKQLFDKVVPHREETVGEMFVRYLQAFIRRYPTFNMPTRIDFGAARVVVMDLDAVAPTGSPDADRQTAFVYMLARHMIARHFFLRPEYAEEVPARVRAYHTARMREVHETAKYLDYDEFHRTLNHPQVREQAERDAREGPKHGVLMGLSSQRAEDFGEYLLGHATAHFVCGAGGAEEAGRLGDLLSLSPSTRQIVQRRLHGPRPDGAGAPFVLVADVNGIRYEQMLVNSPGPVELWALSTTPEDAALRERLYARLGCGEALRRLAACFAAGTAGREVRRRKEERTRRGEDDPAAEAGVVEELAGELSAGVGLGLVMRELG